MADDKGKHDSWITKLGKKFDLMYHITGGDEGKYHKVLNEQLPRAVNKAGSKIVEPFAKIDKKINPLRKIDLYDKIATESETRPGDALATAAGAFFGGGALMGAMGGGAAGGTTAATTGGTTGATTGGTAAGKGLMTFDNLSKAGRAVNMIGKGVSAMEGKPNNISMPDAPKQNTYGLGALGDKSVSSFANKNVFNFSPQGNQQQMKALSGKTGINKETEKGSSATQPITPLKGL